MITLPPPPDARSVIICEYLREVGPYMAQKVRLESAYGAAGTRPVWVEHHIAALEVCIETIMHRIAREHGLDTIENI